MTTASGSVIGRVAQTLPAAHWMVLLVVTAVVALFGLSLQDAATTPIYRGSALVALLVGLIATKAVQDHVAALIFFAAAVTVGAIPPKVAFSGFYAGATWLIYAGAILAAALGEVGLSDRIAKKILDRIGSNYASVVAALIGLSLILAVLIPSAAGRVLLMLPIVMKLAPRIGIPVGSKGYCGMIIATVCGTFLPLAGILTSSNRNVAFAGSAHALYGKPFGYSDYLRWNFPVLTILVSLLLFAMVIWRYREQVIPVPKQVERKRPFEGSERYVLIVVLCALTLWVTDFLHGISPAWIGLCAAIFCIVGPCRALAAPERMGFAPFLMFAALMSMGGVMAHTGLSAALGETLVGVLHLQTGSSTVATVWNLAAITIIGLLISIVGTNLAGPVVLSTLAQPIAIATGWPVETVLVTMMPSMSICIIVFQAPIILIAMRMAEVPLREISLFLLLMSALMFVVVLPLQFVWLGLLGVLP